MLALVVAVVGTVLQGPAIDAFSDWSINPSINDRLITDFERPLNNGLKTWNYIYDCPYAHSWFMSLYLKQYLGGNAEKSVKYVFIKLI